MRASLNQLALKKQRLELRSAALREQIAEDAFALQPGLVYADRLMAGVAWLRRHPAFAVAAFVVVVVARPRGFLRLARGAWLLWLALRRLPGMVPAKLIDKATGWR